MTPLNFFAKRGADVATQVSRRISATVRVWGQRNADAMPTFERICRQVFTFAVEQEESLVNAFHLLEFERAELRAFAKETSRDAHIQAQWSQLQQVKTLREWLQFTVSTENRLSLDADHRSRAVSLFVQRVKDLIGCMACSTVAAGVFADGGEWTGSVEYVSIPAFGETVDCAEVQPTIESFDRILARNPAYLESLEQDAQRQCESKQAQTDGAFASELRPSLARITAALRAPVAGDATDLAGAIRAVLRPGGVALALTDGIQTVRRPDPLVVPPDALVVLLIVPTDTKYGGAKATRAAAEAWQQADGVVVFPYPMLGDRGFMEVVAARLQ